MMITFYVIQNSTLEKFKSEKEYKEEIEKRSNERAKESLDLLQIFDKIDDEGKAQLAIVLDKLSNGDLTRKTDIEIKINSKKVSLKEVIKVCKMLGIHGMIMALNDGYDTILLNNGSNLSNGEKQLLCMARIMVQNPKILILDEATSNIDLKTEQKITKAMDIITKGRTTIMVAHRISTIKNCDKIILIKDHINYEEGTHEELMKNKGEYFKLYNSQSI